VAVAKLPLPSTTVQVTVVVPVLNAAGALLVTLATEQLSVAIGVPKATLVTEQVLPEFNVIADGAIITGLTLSVTTTVCVAVALFPEASVTVQVTIVVPVKKVVGALLTTLATEQLSDVVGVPKLTLNATHPSFAVKATFVGAVIVGNSVSITVTVWLAVAKLPLPSTTVQITVVVPIGNVAGALFVTLATEQLSAVIGVPSTTPVAAHGALAGTVMFNGAEIVGNVASFTTTICVAVAMFPEASVTVHVTVVVPNKNNAGALLVTVATWQLSDVIGVPKATTAPEHPFVEVTSTFCGATSDGLIVSTTVTVWLAVAVLPAASVTVHVTVVKPSTKVVGALLVTLTTLQLSAVTGIPSTTL
jgi:hypothetical protein